MKTRHANDGAILSSIFFPGQQDVAILDDGAMPPSHAYSLLAFGKMRELPGFQRLSFGYVNNPDGSIRWLYPTGSLQPHFLRLYNGAGWRGFLLKSGFSLAFRLGLEHMARSGTVHVYFKNNPPLGGLLDHFPKGEMAIFTGTFGENQKAVVALQDQHGKAWFFKQPLTTAAALLVQNEQEILASLSSLRLEKMAVPIGQPIASGLLVSDVKPRKATNSIDLQPAHFEALAELAQRTTQLLPLSGLPFWEEINGNLAALAHQPILNELPPDVVGRVIEQLLALREALDGAQTVPTALAHGDFTPWNMYLGGDRLHVYDWELSERLPLLFDAFHFIFQSSVLVKRLPYTDIHAAVFSLKNNTAVQAMLGAAHRRFEELYQLYLLRNISYYLLKYLRQTPLHRQAHWQLAAWEGALEALAHSPYSSILR